MDNPKKKQSYIIPQAEIVLLEERPIMVKASPGVGSEWQPGDQIDSKEFGFDSLPTEFKDVWEDF